MAKNNELWAKSLFSRFEDPDSRARREVIEKDLAEFLAKDKAEHEAWLKATGREPYVPGPEPKEKEKKHDVVGSDKRAKPGRGSPRGKG